VQVHGSAKDQMLERRVSDIRSWRCSERVFLMLEVWNIHASKVEYGVEGRKKASNVTEESRVGTARR
jgi:hypothetical protein